MKPVVRASILAVLVFARAGHAQSMRVLQDVAMAEAAYRDAQEAWLRSDPTLERDLFTIDPRDARARIKKNAALRDDVMVKKQGYLDLLIQRTERIRARLAQSDNGSVPAAIIKSDLEQQQSRILDEQQRLEQLIRELPPGDEYLLVRRPLLDERERLVSLQNNIAQRVNSLDKLQTAQHAIQTLSTDDLSQKMDSVLKLWREEREASIRQRAHWAAYYAAMQNALSMPPTPVAAPTGRDGKTTPRGARGRPAASMISAPAPIATRKPSGLAGLWGYRSQPGAWTGYAEPGFVTLELREEAGVLRGTYNAHLSVRSASHEVSLTIESIRYSQNSATLRWNSVKPAADGEMELKLGPDGRLLVERSRSSDSYIPLGSEVLLPK